MLREFILYKAALYLCALAPNQFDTSSQLLLDESISGRIARHLLIFDGVFYASVAKNSGYTFEHEYAFSSVWPLLVQRITRAKSLESIVLFNALASSLCHLLAMYLVTFLAPRRLQTLTAQLFCLSPAGIFLAAGYTEAPFALLSFLGLILFAKTHYILSGLVFGLSCLFRSNGLLFGILFTVKVLRSGPKQFISIVLGASLILSGFLYPQYQAYASLCPGSEWCNDTIPLAYAYIQKTYWNNGFLCYFKRENTPLFLMASPSLILILRSAPQQIEMRLVHYALFIGALFFWHVQIVTRVASCLPGIYVFVASELNKKSLEGRLWASYFVVWGLAQAVLFGAFLPPA